MELIINPNLIKQIMENSVNNLNNKDYSFAPNELKQAINIMEQMGVRSIELDLSSDDESIL